LDLAKYKRLFLQEAREHLRSLGEGIIALETNPTDPGVVDELFRHSHSMKGMSASMGYEPVSSLSHAMEDALDLVRKKKALVTRDLIDLLLASADRLEAMVNQVEESDRPSADTQDLIPRLRGEGSPSPQAPPSPSPPPEATLSPLPPAAEAPASPPPPAPGASAPWGELLGRLPAERRGMGAELSSGGMAPWVAEVTLDRESLARAARSFIILGKLAKEAVLLTSIPDAEEVKKGICPDTLRALILFSGDPEDLRRSLARIPEVATVTLHPVPAGVFAPPPPQQKAPETPPREAPPREGQDLKSTMRTVRVDTLVLDNLIDVVGEMLISHERMTLLSADIPHQEIHEELSSMENLIHRFQETIMGVRMMPIDLVAGRYPRVVRDLAQRSGKEVRFVAEGLEIELDRAVLEKVGEILVHLLRNSVDHGLEEAEERQRKGKPPHGTIRFRAYRDREWVFIEVSDDGRGMSPGRIAAAALERGIVTREALDRMNRDEILMLTTLPSFSTAEKVTDISGRGVGLDAVRMVAEGLGGHLTIATEDGKGTRFSLRIPFSVAVIRLLMVRVGGHPCGLPITRVLHTLEVKPSLVRWSGSEAYLQLRRTLVRLLSLSQLAGFQEALAPEPRGGAILVEKHQRRYAILVEEILGTRDAVIKPLGRPLSSIAALAGATVLGNGHPMVVLDVHRLLP
jgi:two-component system chemotaxis sensor kinase CheA